MALRNAARRWLGIEEKAAMPNPTPPTVEGLNDATVRSVENLVARFRNWNDSQRLAVYSRNLALDAALFNARSLSAVPLRLYRRVASGGGVLKSRPVTKRRMRHLTDPNAVGRKAATMADQAGEVEEVLDAPPLRLLRHPDPEATGMAWDVLRWIDKQHYGECLLLATDEGYLKRLAPQFCRVQPDKKGLISGWYYGRDSIAGAEYVRDEVLQMKWSEHPNNPYRGLGWLELAIREIEIDDYAMASELNRWMEGGYPDFVLAFKDAKTQAQIDEATEKIKQQRRHKAKTIVTSDSTLTPLSVPKDMQYIEGLDLAERRILNRAGIPITLYRMQDANRAAALATDPVYARYTLAPALAVDAEQWTELLLPRFDMDPAVYFFAYDEVVQEDRDSLRSDIATFTGLVWTPNEARAELGYDPIDDPKADQLASAPAPVAGQPGPSNFFSITTPSSGTVAAASVVQPQPPTPAKAFHPLNRKAWTELDPYWHDHDHGTKAAASEIERSIQEVIRSWLSAAASEVTSAAIIRGDINLVSLRAELAAALEPLVAELFREGAATGYAQIGMAGSDLFDVVPQDALDALARHNSLIVERITGTTENGIRRAITAALEEGMSATQAQGAVQAAVLDAAPWRAETIARTETANAQGAGALASWTQAGVEGKRWLLAPDACPICVAMVENIGREGMESKAIGLSEPFARAGVPITGSDGRTYTPALDVYHEPLHPNDRCTVIAEITGKSMGVPHDGEKGDAPGS